jgi:Protein of unknown function (DUF3662)/FHA domain
MGLQAFERRLERLVEGAFTKAFRSGLQPLEIGRRLVKELDSGRTVGVHGVVAPNHFTVVLSPADSERFASFRDALARELADAAREHARDERYHFIGPVAVDFAEDQQRRQGDLRVTAVIEQGDAGWTAALVLPDGRRVPLTGETATIGRLPECSIPLSDPQSSRQHAQVRHDPDGFRIVDLGSTNGTTVNGTLVVGEQLLRDGDVIGVGNTAIRYEES